MATDGRPKAGLATKADDDDDDWLIVLVVVVVFVWGETAEEREAARAPSCS